jgi:hypothetical protein
MYNLPHLLGVAGPHGPGSPRRGRARSGCPTRRSPRAGPCGNVCTSVHPCAHAGAPTGVRTCAPTGVRTGVRTAVLTGVRTGVRTAVLTGVRTGRRPQRRPTRSLPLSLNAARCSPLSISHPLLRLTFAPAPRPCPAYFLEDHRPSPRTRRCLHAFALLLHLYWRFPCRCFSPLFLLFSFSSAVRPLRASGPLLYPFPVVLSASACCSS